MTDISIANHGLIGDLQTAALVSTDGSVDWLCCPRFDSPSVFGGLLDPRGGHFRIHPAVPGDRVRQMYFPDTAVLITRFFTEAGVGEVVDFMPPADSAATKDHRLVRMVRCVRGRMRFAVELAPRFDYGRCPHTVHPTEHGAVFRTDALTLTLHPVREPDDPRLLTDVRVDAGDVHAFMNLSAGDVRGVVVLEFGAGGPPREFRVAEVHRLFDDTVAYWRSWLARSTYTGRWREMVQRSAITLKLMTYAPTGGLVAAPTTSLPEQVGGERNWDYRYTWVRDAALAVSALLRLGFVAESTAFALWLRARVAERTDDRDRLKIMYRVDGSSDLKEELLEGWAGYRGSLPVRIGNDAASQLQLDVFGEAMDSLFLADQRGLPIGHGDWQEIRGLLDWLTGQWNQPEEGIWETRGGRKHFTYGRLMSWVAFDRGIRLAQRHGRPADLGRWTAARDEIYEQIHDHGWSTRRQAFVQHFNDEVLDAALLRMPAVGFITPYDPLWTSTMRAIEEELVVDSLVHRYDPETSPDGLAGSEGTFSLCSFLYVDALARIGRLDDARLAFEKMLTYASPLGLYAEEIDATGEQIGNFPQAFTHLALIEAAVTLDEALDAAARR